jgi:hypothetical protein
MSIIMGMGTKQDMEMKLHMARKQPTLLLKMANQLL